MTPAFELSVVIPTYRRRTLVIQALSALAQQTLPPSEYEVIVCIDGSDDGTQEAVGSFSAPYALRSIRQEHRGRAAACNAGIRVAQGHLVLLLDDDMEASSDCLFAHVRAHQRGMRGGVVGAVPVILEPSAPSAGRYIAGRFDRHLTSLAQPRYVFQLRDFYSGNFSIRRDILLEVGLFDEKFTLYGNEDLELSVRLHRAQVALFYEARAKAYQHYTKDFAALARDNLDKGRTAVLLARKHPETMVDLKLSLYRQGSSTRRLLRSLLLGLRGLTKLTDHTVINAMCYLDGIRAPGLDSRYAFALDYFYWQGAISMLREARNVDPKP